MNHHSDAYRAVCKAVHRQLITYPLLGLPNRLPKHCVKVMLQPPISEQQEGYHDDEDDGNLFTWRPQNSVFLTILKHKEMGSAVYVHESDMHYEASELCMLGPGCPLNTVLLGQALLDNYSDNYRMQVLVFDVLAIGDEDFVSMRMKPMDRYMRLRDLWGRAGVVPPPSRSALHLQWAGHPFKTAKEFSMGANASSNLVHHSAESIILYGMEHPCKLRFIV